MALNILSPTVSKAIADGEAAQRTAQTGTTVTATDWTTQVSDSADTSPTFDTQHEVYTSTPQDAASQNSTGDNSNGVEPTLTLIPTLTYTYTDGYSTEHEESKGLTVGVTQDFSYEFLGVGGSTTLSASGTFNWTDSTGEDKTTSVSASLSAPFTVPAGKIYVEKLLFSQEQVQVPYSWVVDANGWLQFQYEGGPAYKHPIGAAFYFAAGLDPGVTTNRLPTLDGVNWSDFEDDRTTLVYTLHGSLTINGASGYTVKVYDETNGSSQVVQAEYDPAVPIGVHRIMDNAGREFRDTPFDDWVDGGAGDDTMLLTAGEDLAYGMGGADLIQAEGVGRSLLDGGAGDDAIYLSSAARFSTLVGGEGNDRIFAYAPNSQLYGGAGDDLFFLREGTAGGAVVVDAEGGNRLWIDAESPPGFERLVGSDNLYILLGGGGTYDRTRDVVWVDFFQDPANSVNDLDAARIADIAVVFVRPGEPTSASQVLL